MKIDNDWKTKDAISGLTIEVREGKFLNKLHIENIDGTMNRDFFFTPEGKFDGTGSSVNCDKEEK